MAFEKFINKPSNEYELFMSIANDAKNNFAQYHGQHYYLHISDVDGQNSRIDYVQDLKKLDDPWQYTYIEHDRQACILFRSDKNSIAMLLYRERDFGQIQVTQEKVVEFFGGRSDSILPDNRTCPLSPMEMIEAFGCIEESFQEFRRHKVS